MILFLLSDLLIVLIFVAISTFLLSSMSAVADFDFSSLRSGSDPSCRIDDLPDHALIRWVNN